MKKRRRHAHYATDEGLINKLHNDTPLETKVGPQTVLLPNEELCIKNWIIDKARLGFPMHSEDVKDAVQKIFIEEKRPNPFINNRPGRKWFSSFLQRHPEITLKNTEILSKARASVTEENIMEWFDGLKNYVQQEQLEELFDDPKRIINLDELGMLTCPKTGKLLGPRGEKNLYQVASGPEKQSISVLCTFSADGAWYDPMIIYPYQRIPRDVAASVPDRFAIGISDSGWITSATYYKYISNVLYPRLLEKKVTFPVLLVFDGHKSHINIELYNFCTSHRILLYCLYPNATHILQPCDVGIFRPLKVEWKKVVAQHTQTTTQSINKLNFAPLFASAFTKFMKPDIIKNAFAACGLYPLDPNRVDYSKCISTRRKNLSGDYLPFEVNDDRKNTDYMNKECLKLIESNIPVDLLNPFKEAIDSNKNPSTEQLLFTIWKKFSTSSGLTVNNTTDVEPDSESENHPSSLTFSAAVSHEILNQLSLEQIKDSEMVANPGQETLSFDNEKAQSKLDDTVILELNDANFPENLSGTIILESSNCELLINLEDTTIIEENSKNKSGNTVVVESHNCKSSVNLENSVVLECDNTLNNDNNNDINFKLTKDLSNNDRNKIWQRHLHFPQIETTDKKPKKEKIFAITSQQYHELEMKKIQLEIEEKRLKLQKQTEKLIKKEKIEKEKKKEERILKKKLLEEEKLKKQQEKQPKKEEIQTNKKKPPAQARKPKNEKVQDNSEDESISE